MWSPPVEGYAKARAAAERALSLDPDLAEAHGSMAMVLWSADWDWPAAEREIQRALDLNPGYVRGHQSYAQMLASHGRLEEAMDHLRIAEQLDPFWVSPMSVDLGYVLSLRGEPERALAAWKRALELAPNYYRTHLHVGNHLCGTGAYQEGLASLMRARALSPDDPHVTADIGYCHAVSGRPDEARKILRELEELSETRYVSPLTQALVHIGLGEENQALEALERAREARALMLNSIRMDPRYRPLRSEPRFADLLGRLGLPG